MISQSKFGSDYSNFIFCIKDVKEFDKGDMKI